MAKTIDEGKLESPDGHRYLHGLPRTKLGAQPVHDTGQCLGRWIFHPHWDTGEPTPSYVARDGDAYQGVAKAFGT